MLALLFVFLALSSCRREETFRYTIAASCDANGYWADQMFSSLQFLYATHPKGTYLVKISEEGVQKQILQAEELISKKADLIIIASHDVAALRPTLQKAQRRGIPVILCSDSEARSQTDDIQPYTAHVNIAIPGKHEEGDDAEDVHIILPDASEVITKLTTDILAHRPVTRETVLHATTRAGKEGNWQKDMFGAELSGKENDKQELIEQLNEYSLQTVTLHLAFCSFSILAIVMLGITLRFFYDKKKDYHQLSVEKNSLIEEKQKLLENIKNQKKQDDAPFVTKLREIIMNHIDDQDLKIPMLADAMFMSQVQLYRKTKEYTGLTPNQFIQKMRVEYAHSLLEQTDWNVTQVADKSGFQSVQYFIRCFRRYYGFSPGEYKRL